MGERSWITIIVPPIFKNPPVVKATSSLWLGAIHAAAAPQIRLPIACAEMNQITNANILFLVILKFFLTKVKNYIK